MILADVLADTIIDNLKLFPFLFITYLVLEYMEQRLSDKTAQIVQKAGNLGPFIGSLCGAIPQCGFSIVASNFYTVRLISIGTLIAIYLSTSDELLPIMISSGASWLLLTKIISYKICCGIICGYIIDYVWQKKHTRQNVNIEQLCENEHCHCENEDAIMIPALKHSVKIAVFIFIVTLCLNILFIYIHPKAMANLLQTPLLSEMIAGLFGLLPNCSASVVLTQLYLENCINLSTLFSGSLVNGGVGLLVLFRINRNWRENLTILALLYLCGIGGGLGSLFIF